LVKIRAFAPARKSVTDDELLRARADCSNFTQFVRGDKVGRRDGRVLRLGGSWNPVSGAGFGVGVAAPCSVRMKMRVELVRCAIEN